MRNDDDTPSARLLRAGPGCQICPVDLSAVHVSPPSTSSKWFTGRFPYPDPDRPVCWQPPERSVGPHSCVVRDSPPPSLDSRLRSAARQGSEHCCPDPCLLLSACVPSARKVHHHAAVSQRWLIVWSEFIGFRSLILAPATCKMDLHGNAPALLIRNNCGRYGYEAQ